MGNKGSDPFLKKKKKKGSDPIINHVSYQINQIFESQTIPLIRLVCYVE